MTFEDMSQFFGMAATVVGGFLGYGQLRERVNHHEEQLEKTATKESLEPFQAEVLRRLQRIENKQDALNGSPK